MTTNTMQKAASATNANGLHTDTNGADFPMACVQGQAFATSPEKRAVLEAIRRAHPGISSTVQCDRIRAALAQYSITTYEITRYLDCYDARARVCQLRKQGVAIATHWRTIITDAGEKHRVGLYAMAGVSQ